MNLIDVNLVLYATNERSPHHERAHRWFEQTMSSGEPVGLPLMVLLAFVRLTTNPRVLDPPLSPQQAIEYVETWRQHPTVVVPEPTARHFDLVLGLLEATGTGGNLVSDAHLAALAIEHRATLCSTDTDFRRFPGLVSTNPLEE